MITFLVLIGKSARIQAGQRQTEPQILRVRAAMRRLRVRITNDKSRYNLPMQVTVEIPDQFVPFLMPEGTDVPRKLLEDTVAAAYRERRLTMEQVRQILGFATRMEVDPFLQKYEIYDYTVEDLKQDMAALDALLGPRKARKTA